MRSPPYDWGKSLRGCVRPLSAAADIGGRLGTPTLTAANFSTKPSALPYLWPSTLSATDAETMLGRSGEQMALPGTGDGTSRRPARLQVQADRKSLHVHVLLSRH